jgi:hypothetical protein
MSDKSKINNALDYANKYGGIDGDHHKMWVIDQMVRALTGCPMVTKTAKDFQGITYEFQAQGESVEYMRWVNEHCQGEYGAQTYGWDRGIAP